MPWGRDTISGSPSWSHPRAPGEATARDHRAAGRDRRPKRRPSASSEGTTAGRRFHRQQVSGWHPVAAYLSCRRSPGAAVLPTPGAVFCAGVNDRSETFPRRSHPRRVGQAAVVEAGDIGVRHVGAGGRWLRWLRGPTRTAWTTRAGPGKRGARRLRAHARTARADPGKRGVRGARWCQLEPLQEAEARAVRGDGEEQAVVGVQAVRWNRLTLPKRTGTLRVNGSGARRRVLLRAVGSTGRDTTTWAAAHRGFEGPSTISPAFSSTTVIGSQWVAFT